MAIAIVLATRLPLQQIGFFGLSRALQGLDQSCPRSWCTEALLPCSSAMCRKAYGDSGTWSATLQVENSKRKELNASRLQMQPSLT
eukprot:8514875-Lingulodinium_polyedra.AAC.1